MPETILITGANRGLGLELTRQYANLGWQVVACCRDPDNAVELGQLASSTELVQVMELDVTRPDHIERLAEALDDRPLEILLNNAGTYGQTDARFGNTDPQRWLDAFAVNTVGPMKVVEALLPNVLAGRRKVIASMSSKMGSIADNTSGGSYVYRSTKAALNMVMRSAAIDLQPRGAIVVMLHPGWVLTDMGGPNAEITVEESVRNLRRILEGLSEKDAGSFFDIDGSIMPW